MIYEPLSPTISMFTATVNSFDVSFLVGAEDGFAGWLAKIIETEVSLATPSIAKSLYTFTIKVNR